MNVKSCYLFFIIQYKSPSTHIPISNISQDPLGHQGALVQLSLWSSAGSLSGVSRGVSCILLGKICHTTSAHSDKLQAFQTGSQKRVQNSGEKTTTKLQCKRRHGSQKVLSGWQRSNSAPMHTGGTFQSVPDKIEELTREQRQTIYEEILVWE